jgi:hypothetical protein
MRTVRFTTIPTIIALAVSSVANADLVYSQTLSDLDSTDFGWYSSSEPRPTRNFKHADNFTLTAQSHISQINWWGMTEGAAHTDLQNFDQFQIEFYTSRTTNNNRIKPDTLIASQTFDLSSIITTNTGHQTAAGVIKYQHQATLTNTVTLDANTTYWIAISARSIDPTSDTWQWLDSDLADADSSSYDYNTDRWLALRDTDSAFQLFTIPSPATTSLLLISPIAARRRRPLTP